MKRIRVPKKENKIKDRRSFLKLFGAGVLSFALPEKTCSTIEYRYQYHIPIKPKTIAKAMDISNWGTLPEEFSWIPAYVRHQQQILKMVDVYRMECNEKD